MPFETPMPYPFRAPSLSAHCSSRRLHFVRSLASLQAQWQPLDDRTRKA